MSSFKLDSSGAIEEAAQSNLDIVYPLPNQLQIDIDHDDSIGVMWENYNILSKTLGYKPLVTVKPSKSGLPHRHVTMTFDAPLDPWQRIAYQACLGSDRKREILSSCRILINDPHPTLFLEPKKNAETCAEPDFNIDVFAGLL